MFPSPVSLWGLSPDILVCNHMSDHERVPTKNNSLAQQMQHANRCGTLQISSSRGAAEQHKAVQGPYLLLQLLQGTAGFVGLGLQVTQPVVVGCEQGVQVAAVLEPRRQRVVIINLRN